jgi:hypothetical protein
MVNGFVLVERWAKSIQDIKLVSVKKVSMINVILNHFNVILDARSYYGNAAA